MATTASVIVSTGRSGSAALTTAMMVCIGSGHSGGQAQQSGSPARFLERSWRSLPQEAHVMGFVPHTAQYQCSP
jgi:hypothetical protein